MSLFYHSFPRRKHGEPESEVIARGTAILKSMAEIGFLLTPEKIEWRSPTESSLETFARRMCFTLLDVQNDEELSKHSDRFGPFSIGLEPQALVALGGLPAIYLPNRPDNPEGLAALGAEYLHKIAEIERLLKALELAAAAAGATGNPDHNLRFRHIRSDHEEEVDCSAESAKAFLNGLIKHNEISDLQTIRQAFMGFVELIYPSGSEERLTVGELGYYHQREWKISGQMTLDEKRLSRHLIQSERDRLMASDPDFFGQELTFLGKIKTWADETMVFQTLQERPVAEYISEVIAPQEALADVAEIASTHGLPFKPRALKH